MKKEEFIETWSQEIGNNILHSDYVNAFIIDLDLLLQAERERCAVKVKNLYLQLTGREKGSRHLVQQSGKGMRDSYNLALADSAKAIREENLPITKKRGGCNP